MSGIYIPMEMPKGCAFCKISRRNGKKMICPFIRQREWDIHDPTSADHRLDGCPLIPVHDHGRLIEADRIELYMQDEWMNNELSNGDWILFRERLKETPTIIPADKEGEG